MPVRDTGDKDARRQSILEDLGLQGILGRAESDLRLTREALVDEFLALDDDDMSLTNFLKEKRAAIGDGEAKGVEQ